MMFNQPKDYTEDDIDYTDVETEPKRFNSVSLVIAIVMFSAIVFGLTKCSNDLQSVIF